MIDWLTLETLPNTVLVWQQYTMRALFGVFLTNAQKADHFFQLKPLLTLPK